MVGNAAVIQKINPVRAESQHEASYPAMPLGMVETGKQVCVHSIRGKDETRRFLANLGFVEGAEVTVVCEMGGNVIVNVKGSRIAVSRAMANRVMTA